MPITYPLLAGTLAAMTHVLTGPDHLAAVTPLVVESKHKAWRIGLAWGLGHLSGMLLIGVLFALLRERLPVERISGHSELLVGVVLIGVGTWSFMKIFRERKKQKHPHFHGTEHPYIHVHGHAHGGLLPDHVHTHEHVHPMGKNAFSSFWIGIIHGLAGIAHIFLLIPLLSFGSTSLAVQYLIGFGIGTVLAMTGYALVLGRLATYTKQAHNGPLFTGIRLTAGLFAVVIGVYWIITNM